MTTTLMMQLTTPLGADVLRFRSMSAYEEMSRLFEYRVTAICDQEAIDLSDLLAKPAAVSVEVQDGELRWFHGIVASASFSGVEGRHFVYRLTLRPWLWLLTSAQDIRIFQNKTTRQIIEDIFAKYAGFTTSFKLGARTYEPRVYCVQYRETDFNFVSRLMEEEGIFYFFKHSADKHELVIADAPTAHEAMPGDSEVLFLEDDRQDLEHRAITNWNIEHTVQSGKVVLKDYNFETPSASMLATSAASSRTHSEAAHEVYDYPGLYPAQAKGDALVPVRLQEHETMFPRASARGNHPVIACGTRFTLKGHPRDDQNIEYIVLSTQIEMRQAGYEAGFGGDTLYLVVLNAIDSREPFRPQRTTRKPTVGGPQTAVVVGEGAAGDITTDKYGRVKVQFHWDRVGKKTAESSCWLRVASGWAGHGWGMVQLPRHGQEVVVDFLEGDPDQPLITGRVYNAEQMPPYELPANKTVSTVKSRSKLGGADEFNELRFEDLPGSEYVYFQAQKDQLELVKNIRWTHIKKDEHFTVTGHRYEKIESTDNLTVLGDSMQKYGGVWSQQVAKDILIGTDEKWSLKATKDITVKTDAAASVHAASGMHLKSDASVAIEGGQNVHIKGGMNVVIEAGTQLTLKVGGSFVVIGPTGVAIKGPIVQINSGGAAGSGDGCSPVAPTDPKPPTEPKLPEDPLTHF